MSVALVELPSVTMAAADIYPSMSKSDIRKCYPETVRTLRQFQVFTILKLQSAFDDHAIWTPAEIAEVLRQHADRIDKYMTLYYPTKYRGDLSE